MVNLNKCLASIYFNNAIPVINKKIVYEKIMNKTYTIKINYLLSKKFINEININIYFTKKIL